MRTDGIRVQSEDGRRGRRFTRIAHGVIRNREHARALLDHHVRLAVHAGLEQAFAILQRDEHGEHRDVLLDHGLRLDLFHEAGEPAIGIRVHRDRGGLAWTNLPDVRLVEQCADSHLAQVGHLEQRRAATERTGRGRDDGAERHGSLDDRTAHRRRHRRVLKALFRQVHCRGRGDELRSGVRIVQLSRLVLGRRDDSAFEQLVGALLLRGRYVELRPDRRERRRRLIILILGVTRLDLHEQVARFDQRPGFDGHLHDLTGCLRLDFHNVDGLDDASRLCVDHDIAARDSNRRDRDRLWIL